jgi:hypothetical protein
VKEGDVKRHLALTCLVVAVAVMISGTAHAAGAPEITPLTGEIDLGNLNEGATGDVCAFDVGMVVHFGAGARQITFPDPLGGDTTSLLVGPLTATVTNLETGESLTVNISGPTFLDATGFIVKGTGAWLSFEPISEGGLRYIHGRLAFEPVPYGLHAVVLGGVEEDLCARLA